MFIQPKRVKEILGVIVGPFSVATSLLLLVLSLLEYFRRGFVSLFFDLRILAVIAIILWLASTALSGKSKKSWTQIVIGSLAVIALLPILYKTVAPYGRSGLAVLGLGFAVTGAIILSLLFTPKDPPSDNLEIRN